MASSIGCSAVVLAGGRSSRFGSDKLAVELAGEPLLHHALRPVAEACEEVVVVAGHGGLTVPPPPDLPVAVRVIADEEAFLGPLAGLLHGARAARGVRLLVVAGDMPGLVPAVMRRLRAWPEDHDGACLEHRGSVQPLPLGLDRSAALRMGSALTERGHRSLRDLIRGLRIERIPESAWRALDPDARSLLDIDRPSDLSQTGPERTR